MAGSDVSSVTNHFPTVVEGFNTTTSGSTASGATSIALSSVTNLTDGKAFVGLIEPGDAKEQAFTGTVDVSGSQITGVKWTRGTNTTHASGVTVVDYTTGTLMNMITKGILVHADQDGTLKANSVDSDMYVDGSIDTAHLADASVTNAKLSTTAGEVGGAWKTWTPSWTNVSGGTLNYATYTKIGKTIHFKLKYTLGGAGVSGEIRFSLPETAHANLFANNPINGIGAFNDTGTGRYPAALLYVDNANAEMRPWVTSGTYNNIYTATSSTIPFTWANTDVIVAEGTYEAA